MPEEMCKEKLQFIYLSMLELERALKTSFSDLPWISPEWDIASLRPVSRLIKEQEPEPGFSENYSGVVSTAPS